MITTGFYERKFPWFDGKDEKLIVLDTNTTYRGDLLTIAYDASFRFDDTPTWTIRPEEVEEEFTKVRELCDGIPDSWLSECDKRHDDNVIDGDAP
jgi:hypothetical protein